MKKPMVAAFHFLTSKVDKEKADEFFNQLIQNGDLEEGSPARALKEFAEKFPRGKHTPGQIRMCGIALLTAWQAFVDGRGLRKITPSAEILRLPIKW